MASQITKIAGILGGATAINTTYQITNRQDPVPSIVTAGIFFALLVGLGSLGGERGLRVAKIFAYIILLAVILGRGFSLFENINKLVGGLTAPTAPMNRI